MSDRVVIVGAGPAGLAAGLELARRGRPVCVLEALDRPGGLARTEEHNGNLYDIGGHRFYTKVDEIERLWREVMGEDMLEVRRLSRIRHRGNFLHYPLRAFEAFRSMGAWEGLQIVLSYGAARLRPVTPEESLEDWVRNRFGQRLYETFFKGYTEKVWGIPCRSIGADWAAQRIQGLSLSRAASNAVFGTNGLRTLAERFAYPRRGPGMMWQRFAEEIVRLGGEVRYGSRVTGFRREGARVSAVTVQGPERTYDLEGGAFVSTMAIGDLALRMRPRVPARVSRAARGLRHRDFMLVLLVLDRPALFPDNWVYVHEDRLRVGRIQNYGNWSAELVAQPGTSSLGMEYFVNEGDDLWSRDDASIVELARTELEALRLSGGARVVDAHVLRQPKAYPVYDATYRRHLAVLRAWVEDVPNLQTIGRNGLHRYNNQDHSMLTGLYAARNILGEAHDVWDVNTDRSYYEDVVRPDKPRARAAEVPGV